MSSSSSRNLLNSLWIFLLVAVLAGCDSLSTRDEIRNQHPQAHGTPAPVTGRPTTTTPSKETPVTTAPVPTSPIPSATPLPPRVLPKVGVILGPGGMKTYAHLGVLREMQRARIPVFAITGLEWGAVMAAAFATQGQVNDAEWKAYKLRESEMPESGFLSKALEQAPVSKVEPFLSSAFGSTTFERTRVFYACPSTQKGSATTAWLARGSLKDGVGRCLPYPPLFQDQNGWMASPFAVDEAAAWLRAQGANVILLVNVLGQGEYLPSKGAGDTSPENLIWSEIRRELYRTRGPAVNHVINVNTSGHPVTDYNGRRELMDAGQKAATEVLNKMVSEYGF